MIEKEILMHTDLMQSDIIILGGGIIGLTVANLCADRNFNVIIVERHNPEFTWSNNTYDMRCSAISGNSRQIFEKIGIWQCIKKERVSRYQSMLVWDALGFNEIRFEAADVAE